MVWCGCNYKQFKPLERKVKGKSSRWGDVVGLCRASYFLIKFRNISKEIGMQQLEQRTDLIWLIAAERSNQQVGWVSSGREGWKYEGRESNEAWPRAGARGMEGKWKWGDIFQVESAAFTYHLTMIMIDTEMQLKQVFPSWMVGWCLLRTHE